ncbi:MAG: hypothetical protein V9H26_18355 [Verrucomicrobiota bacterium]|nr:hypothetical protein [Verrucomicrobiota bacterium]MCC6822732.1 hypothetical protein [Limisphaerales bacterium]
MNDKPMELSETMRAIRDCATQMNARYGSPVFDEWVVVSLQDPQPRVLGYVGPRHEAFAKNFSRDLGGLRASLLTGQHQVGDFEFARHAAGTSFEAFMVLGEGLYLICNNTRCSMDEIARNPRWLSAQVPFADLSERMCAASTAGVR